MRLALLSDIHANLRAFEACLAHAAAAGASHYALLGDLVGYGAEPAAVVDRAMALAARGAVVLRGNHDEAALAPAAVARTAQDQGAAWAGAQLDAAQRAFLAGLPLVHRQPPLMLVHASAQTPEAWLYVDGAQRATAALEAAGPQVRQLFCGHVHEQGLYYRGTGRDLMHFEPTPGVPVPLSAHRQWLATIGSVGQPRDGKPAAMYALWDAPAGRLVFHRVPYDHMAAAAAIRAAGQPEAFARRLEEGR